MRLTDYSIAELEALMSEWGEPSYRAGQIFQWLHKGTPVSEMQNLPRALRLRLEEIPYGGVSVFQKRISSLDGTAKYLFLLEDDNLIEGVLMRYRYGNTACISTQVGCRMGCRFCASTLEGRVRDLSAGEMLSEITAIEKDEPAPAGERTVTNVVLMGSGEPLDNFDEVVRFLRLVTDPNGMNISPRNISVSTCGLVPLIYRFMKEAPHVTLSISLHAHDDETRSRIMPINKVYPLQDVVNAARLYAVETGRRVIFEYALVDGVNSSEECAAELASRLRGINCHVNLIPLNSVKERELNGVTRAYAHTFEEWLNKRHISATVRRELGTDIDGACGQLRNKHAEHAANDNTDTAKDRT
ncbi:MAG: 23S rRNA (adenine(2503)-C(2))-methyltransferase RlmN [Clostridia bacterium]|nr:23S rRNA (adenine(2503)-C(2))-methyltransferase RlmN [Clostridia bacterium]